MTSQERNRGSHREEILQRIMAIETMVQVLEACSMRASSETGALGAQITELHSRTIQVESTQQHPDYQGGGKNRRPLLESKAVANQKIFGGQRKEFNEWGDKLKNAITTSNGSNREVFKNDRRRHGGEESRSNT